MNYEYDNIREGVMMTLLENGLGYDEEELGWKYCSECDQRMHEVDTGMQYCKICDDFLPLSQDCPYAINEQIFMQELNAIVDDFINALKKKFA